MNSFTLFLVVLLIVLINAQQQPQNVLSNNAEASEHGSTLSPPIFSPTNGIGAHRYGAMQPPQQVHINLTNKKDQMVITWLTADTTPKSFVQYGTTANELKYETKGNEVTFMDLGNLKTNRTVHTVLLTQLEEDTRYYYRVGDSQYSWSTVYSFKTLTYNNEILTFATYGDFGDVNAVSLTTLQDEVVKENLDAIIHIGDFAYDLDSDNGRVGDVFMNEIAPLAANLPYMGCPGNHESNYNFTHYTNRFNGLAISGSESLSDTNWWYSFEVISGGATAHFVAISTEVYYYTDEYDLQVALKNQYTWLEKDLQNATARNVDWIFMYGHRPMYCSQVEEKDCTRDPLTLRNGINGSYAVEPLLQKYGVDIYFTAHLHAYERTWPVYQGQFETFENEHVYTNAKYPVHIVTGSAGCQEGHDWFIPGLHGRWSVKRSDTFGYGHLQIHNATHLYWEQLIDEGKQGTDVLWIVKNN